ncbi:hypothetical protein [Paenibacillus naphthalenovorans]|uniref:Uncharacterized protein n=1 Tax=Paenibacillus naphthalenovorans TaxID=162209 RepID=A0A0U2UK11_9BACL|nr:hypothetical protein [Paenibacillus naphthalenovorans]ALS22273.1 hypothetical protein IJ22_18990 [Paenibacillus naphthalenovorans]
MYRFKLMDKSGKLYDKVFAIIDKHAFLFKISSDNEYQDNDGYVIEFNSLPAGAYEEIIKLKGIIEL